MCYNEVFMKKDNTQEREIKSDLFKAKEVLYIFKIMNKSLLQNQIYNYIINVYDDQKYDNII